MPPAPAAAARGPARAGKSTRAGRADQSGKATKSDVRRLRTQAAAEEKMSRSAYEAGLGGTPFDEGLFAGTPGAREAYDTGAEERRAGRRAAAVDRTRGAAQTAAGKVQGVAGVRGPAMVNDGAGFLLGLVGYALVLNYLRGGAPQVKGWLRAKFINKPMGQS